MLKRIRNFIVRKLDKISKKASARFDYHMTECNKPASGFRDLIKKVFYHGFMAGMNMGIFMFTNPPMAACIVLATLLLGPGVLLLAFFYAAIFPVAFVITNIIVKFIEILIGKEYLYV
jgi:hypothetical protein